MAGDDQRSKELQAFLHRALEIELEDPQRQLTEEELKGIALKSGLTEDDWVRLREVLQGHLDRGRNFLEFRNADDAVAELDQAVVLAPYRVDVLHDCGAAHALRWKQNGSREDRDRAKALFERCLGLEPSHPGAAEGLSLLKQGETERSTLRGRRIAAIAAAAALVLAGGSIYFYRSSSPSKSPATVLPAPALSAQIATDTAVQRAGNVSAFPRFGATGPAFPETLPSDIRQIVVGFNQNGHVLALRENGTIVAWGANDSGQATPPPLDDITQIAAGWGHSLALRKDGTVVAWGENSDGQCNIPAGLEGVIQISAGARHSVALRSDGTVVAWGANQVGQSEVPDDLKPVARLGEIFGSHTVVITRDGKLAAWGENGSQECEVPNDQIGSASVVQVWSGGENYALLDDGRLLHWGRQLRGKAFPAESSGIDAVFSGYPAAVIVRDTEGNISVSGAAQSRPVFLKELKNWEKVIVGPQFIYGISE